MAPSATTAPAMARGALALPEKPAVRRWAGGRRLTALMTAPARRARGRRRRPRARRAGAVMRAVNLLPPAQRRTAGFSGNAKAPLAIAGAVVALGAMGYWGYSVTSEV